MPAPDITAQDRQHAYRQLAEQLQRLGKSAAQAGDMAKKVEMAAYNKAANQAHYHQLWQTSLRKAQTAIQQQQAQQQAQQAQQQAQLAQQQAQQQAQQAQQQAQLAQQQAQLAQQQAQQQAQQRAQLAAQQQAQQQAQLAAQQQAQQQAQYAAQQQQQQQQAQYAAQQQAQRAAMLQRQQQAQQQVQYQQQQQQYVAQPVAVGAAQQQYMSAAPQRQQAPQQMQYMQAPQQQAQQVQQPMQYGRQPGAQQYAQPMQPGGQPQYVQVPQAGGQPQYVQQQQYAQQPAAGHAMQQQYMQQARAVQQAPQAQHAAPASLQAQVAQGQVQQQQQQYVQAAPMAVPQHVGGRVPPQGGMAPGMQQQPGMDDFMAGFPAAEAGGMLPHGMPYDAQQAQQVAMPTTSTTASSVPVAVVGESGAGSIAASVAAGARRPLNHEPGPLQEFLRLHSAFNEPRNRAVNIRDSEGMLRWHGDLIKRDPSQANKISMHIKRNSAVLALLKSQRPAEEMGIKESVKQAVKSFLVDLKNFRDHLRRSAAKAAAAQQAAAAAAPNGGGTGPAVGSPASTGGFLAMMDSGKLDGSAGTAQLPASGSLPQPGGSLPQPGGLLPQPGGGGATKPTQGRPPAAPGSAASVAAEAARQQALLRHRQAAAAAGAEQQRRAAAAVPAGPPLPADPTQRLLAVAQQPSNQGETAAVRSGFQRLQRALQMEEQRQLAAQVADVPTPPLPPEAQRLVARERAAMEAAAGAGACSPGARAVVSAPSGQGHVAAQETAAAAGEAEGQPAAKRARSASPDPLAEVEAAGGGGQQAQQAQRPRSDLERRIASECEEAAAALGGALAMRAAPDSQEAGCVTVACMPAAAQQQGHDSGIKPSWQLLMLRVPPGYPEQPPTAVFRHAGSGGAGTVQSSAAALQLQLSDAAAEAFIARVAVLPPPHRLLPLAQAWLEATREVAGRLAARQAALE